MKPVRALFLACGSALLATSFLLGCREEAPQTTKSDPDVVPTPRELSGELDRADELLDARRYKEAEVAFARALEAARELKERGPRWRALHGWARARLTLGFHEDAKASLAELRRLASGDPGRGAETARFTAAVFHREGNLVDAEKAARRSVELARRSGDWKIETNAQSMLATVFSLSGRHAEALRIDEELVAQVRAKAPGSRELALELNEVGIDYRHFGRFEDASRVFEESHELYRDHGDIEGQAMALYNLASVYSLTGDVERALELKLRSLSQAEKVGHTYGLGLLNEEIGETFLDSGNFDRARRYLERALETNRRAQQVYGELNSLESLARLELESGNADRAEDLLSRAITVAEEKGYRQQFVTLRIALSRAAVMRGDEEAALALAKAAVMDATEVSDPEVEFRALEAEGRALEAMGRIEDALAVDLEAIALLESWRGRMALGDLRMGVARPRWDVFESAVRGLFALGRIREAFEISERAKARLLLELMVARRVGGPRDDGGDDLRAELRARYAALESASPEEKTELRRDIGDLTDELDALQQRLRQTSPAVAASRYPTPSSSADLNDVLLGSDRGFLVYLWGERDVYGWWLDEEGIRGQRVGRASELRSLVEFLRLSVEDPDSPSDWRPAAHRAYQVFVAPLLDGDPRELHVVADGPLSLIPFEVLLPSAEGPPLGLTHAIAYGPSASVLSTLMRSAPPPRARPQMLALAYSPPGPVRIDPGEAVLRHGDLLFPIPEAVSEAEFIVDLFRPRGATLLVGPSASFDGLRRARPQDYRYLHFAAHARTSDRAPDRGYLLLSDGRLTAGEIRTLEIGADVVTLSGCETGLGQRIRGEGVVGLAHAFLAAGARSTVVSLWKVEDRRAAELMRDFYRALRGGKRPAEALVDARRAALDRGGESGHPSVWAPFVLVGAP